jgi:hypothetical protein
MSDDAVWNALARALTGEYDIVARLGVGSSGAPVYLARELVTDKLVAIRLPPLVSGNESQEYGLEIVRQIDASLPEIEGRCAHCGAKVRRWSRFCMRCGSDISGIAPSDSQSREDLRDIVRRTALGKYEMLGEMTRADGGGLVYFGRERSSGQILGLQLERGPGENVSIRATQFAAHDPSIQLPEPRQASDSHQKRRVSVPRKQVGRSMTRHSARAVLSMVDARLNTMHPRTLAVIAVVLLLVLVWFSTCQLL